MKGMGDARAGIRTRVHSSASCKDIQATPPGQGGLLARKGRQTYNLFALHDHWSPVSSVRINPHWVPKVRFAARKYRRDLKRAKQKFETAIHKGGSEGDAMQVMCAEEAQAVITLLDRLGYGGNRKKAPSRDRLDLEIKVHELDESASINFFRVFLAQRKNMGLDRVFSRRGKKDTLEDAEALRRRHIDELTGALHARNAALAWLGQ